MTDYFDKFRGHSIEFMNERKKGMLSAMLNRELHITDFDFIRGDDGEYAVMIFAEDDKNFYFGNSIITEMLKEIDADDARDALAAQPVIFIQRQNRSGKRTYTAFELPKVD